jgi:hypothetical protein
MIKWFLSSLLFASSLIGLETVTDPNTGEAFPKEVNFDYDGKSYALDATGVATRKKLVVKVYSIAHYLQKGEGIQGGDPFQKILSDNLAKQLTIQWVRDVSHDKMQEAFQEAFHKVFPDTYNRDMKAPIEQFLKLFPQDVHKGDQYVIRWIPGGTIEVLINGKETGHFTNPEFAKGVWSIWLGPYSIVKRDELVSLMSKT